MKKLFLSAVLFSFFAINLQAMAQNKDLGAAQEYIFHDKKIKIYQPKSFEFNAQLQDEFLPKYSAIISKEYKARKLWIRAASGHNIQFLVVAIADNSAQDWTLKYNSQEQYLSETYNALKKNNPASEELLKDWPLETKEKARYLQDLNKADANLIVERSGEIIFVTDASSGLRIKAFSLVNKVPILILMDLMIGQDKELKQAQQEIGDYIALLQKGQ